MSKSMDSGYMSKIAYSRIGSIFGYHNVTHIHHIDLYARPEGLRDRSTGSPDVPNSGYTVVSSYSRVVFQVSKMTQFGSISCHLGIGPK